ncbi:MAG: hypothetical protein D6679_11225 [Candidatus Hydrogenedentota bacterium]|nr:MAG: hypothetical protein D6679_11225 [Candidatus Hydrogenedentota bacterium]
MRGSRLFFLEPAATGKDTQKGRARKNTVNEYLWLIRIRYRGDKNLPAGTIYAKILGRRASGNCSERPNTRSNLPGSRREKKIRRNPWKGRVVV